MLQSFSYKKINIMSNRKGGDFGFSNFLKKQEVTTTRNKEMMIRVQKEVKKISKELGNKKIIKIWS